MTHHLPRVELKFTMQRTLVLSLASLLVSLLASARADDAKHPERISLGEGAVSLPVPQGWVAKQPRVRFIEHEFEVPPAEGDERPARVTMMGAGGSVEANIDRWAAQFSQPDGSSTREKLKTKKLKVEGQDVTLVDISGTYDDKPAPQVPGPGVQRENYRMLAAIIQTHEGDRPTGNYFIKLYGPAKTVEAQDPKFVKMIEELKTK